jgi:hypothetical protein
MTFSYQIYTTFETPNGNTTNIQNNMFTVNILSVTPGAPHGEVGYTLTVAQFNNTEVANSTSTTSAENFTTIFDPYDNFSYLGNIGFWPFTYTDLEAGKQNNLTLMIPVSNVPHGNTTTTVYDTQLVNASVARPRGLIDVNLTWIAFKGAHPTTDVMRFNATSGVLEYSKETTNLISTIEKIFTYALVDYTRASPLNLWYLPFIAVGIIVAVAVVAWARRDSPAKRKEKRMRERLGK